MALETIRAIVRIRPLNDRERAQGCTPLVHSIDLHRVRVQYRTLNNEDCPDVDKEFTVDRVFSPFCTQEKIFTESAIETMLDHALDGYSATILAYGQTGSGKTFTMSGNDSQFITGFFRPEPTSGLIPRSLTYLTNKIATLCKSRPDTSYCLQASFLEIYNEVPVDLLRTPPSGRGGVTPSNLFVRWGHDGGFFIENQIVVECQSLDDLMAVFAQGHRNRHVSAHQLNADSSRSHCILTISIRAIASGSLSYHHHHHHIWEHQDDDDDGTSASQGNRALGKPLRWLSGSRAISLGKVSFVDLAGSERLRDSKSSGEAVMKETSGINRSLFLLGKVISALSLKQSGAAAKKIPSKAPAQHVPYRDSLLTKLLMDSIGGSGKTLMIACVSPANQQIKETLSTLLYACRTRRIQNRPVKRVEQNYDAVIDANATITQLESHCSKLEQEVQRLREVISSHGMNPDDDPSRNTSVHPPPNQLPAGPRSLGPTVTTRPYDPTKWRPTAIPDRLPSVQQSSRFMTPPQVVKSLGKQIQGLLEENAGLQDKKQEHEKKLIDVVNENERLTEKVKNLEKIFVEDNHGTANDGLNTNGQGLDLSISRRQSIIDPIKPQIQMSDLNESLVLRRSKLKLRAELEKTDRIHKALKTPARNIQSDRSLYSQY